MARQRVLIKTFGCSLNQSDSEAMAGILEQAGYEVIHAQGKSDANSWQGPEEGVPAKGSVDAVIINTCSVKNLAEAKFFKELRNWRNKRWDEIKSDESQTAIIIAGCIPQAEPSLLSDRLCDVSIIGTRQIVHVAEIVSDAIAGKVVHNIENDRNERLNLPKMRRTGIIEILPISEGCLGSCTYCKTKLARGNLLSYPKEKIIGEFKRALRDGCKEFWITSQDNGCYGFDIYRKEKYFLPQLLSDLLSIEGDFKIRLGMSNPDHIDRIKDDLVRAFEHPKIFKFLHIPLQAGNERVLELMKRNYSAGDYIGIVELFRSKIPQISICTDIIVGFPTETDQEFENTKSIVLKTRPDVMNLSRFWLRKGTEAERLEQLYSGVIKSRSEEMKRLFDDMNERANREHIGREYDVLIDEIGIHHALKARTDSYRQVVIKEPKDARLGEFVKVRITGSTKYSLHGEII